jgi:hypothetical protein
MTRRAGLLAIIKPFVPPIIWKVVRLVFRKLIIEDAGNQVVSYQCVTQQKFLWELHYGAFSTIHEKFALLDTHINNNTNTTRLRVYTLCTWAQVALTNTKHGDFLTVGVSFGTSSLVVSEFLKLENHDRKQYFIDPMDGRGRDNYNCDRTLVESRWNHTIPLIWIQEPLSSKSLENIDFISFAHLNTGDWQAEIECLPMIYPKLVAVGGILVMDNYGWMPREKQLVVNQLLDKMGAKYFITPSLQLIVIRQ